MEPTRKCSFRKADSEVPLMARGYPLINSIKIASISLLNKEIPFHYQVCDHLCFDTHTDS